MRRLIQRYLLTFEKTRYQSAAPQLTVERLGDSRELKDLITQLQGVLKSSEEIQRSTDAAKSRPKVSSNRVQQFSLDTISYQTWLILRNIP